MINIFTKEELRNIKSAVNQLIASKIVYLNSDISDEEREYSEESIKDDYKLLEKVLELLN